MDCEDATIRDMKFLLYCFEWMSGLKINYYKSEVVVFGVSDEEQWRIANMLNCKVRVLPMKYLGFPISNISLGVSSSSEMVGKMRNKLQPWKGKHLSYRGRPVLTSSSLSSIPTYMCWNI
jgi:hypothetical protein